MNRSATLSLLVLSLALSLGGCEATRSSTPGETADDADRPQGESEIATGAAVDSSDYAIEIYDVTDLLSVTPSLVTPGKQFLALSAENVEATIKRRTGGEAVWKEPASYELHRGQMIVNQTRVIHRKILEVLVEIRHSRS